VRLGRSRNQDNLLSPFAHDPWIANDQEVVGAEVRGREGTEDFEEERVVGVNSKHCQTRPLAVPVPSREPAVFFRASSHIMTALPIVTP